MALLGQEQIISGRPPLENYKVDPADPSGLSVNFADGPSVDAFQRLRVSTNYTILDLKQNNDNLPLFYDDAETSGSGTSSTYNTNKASTTIAVSATTAGTRIRQSKMWGQYQPGKSQLILITANFNGGAAGITKRVGLFWDRWGLFFELDGTTLCVSKRTYNTGSAVDTQVEQQAWNIDKLDGTGKSGITIDTTKTQIMMIDYEWLGVGRVRFGFIVDGKIYYCHEMNHANVEDEVYMSNPNAPIRFEISNDGTGAAADLDTMCASIQSEGGQEENTLSTYISRDGTPITLANQDLWTPAISIRLKSDRICTRVTPVSIDVLLTDSTNYEWALFLNPTIAGSDAVDWTDITNSALQYDVSRTNANTLSGGYLIDGGYGASTNQGKIPTTGFSASFLTIGSNIDGALDEFVLGVKNIDGNGGTCYAGITSKEYC